MSSVFQSPYRTPALQNGDWRRQIWADQVDQVPSAFPVAAPAAGAPSGRGGSDATMRRWNDGAQFMKNLTGYDVNKDITGLAKDIGGDWGGNMMDTYLKGGKQAAIGAAAGQAANALGLGGAAAGASGAAGAGGASGALGALGMSL